MGFWMQTDCLASKELILILVFRAQDLQVEKADLRSQSHQDNPACFRALAESLEDF